MARHKKRALSEEDRELWHRVAKTATPMHPVKPTLPSKPKPERPKPANETVSDRFEVPSFRVGQTASMSRPVPKPAPASSPIDRKQLLRLKRGKLKPEARIDLHGMTQDRALPELTRFILGAAERNLRLVLVITGKGRPRPDFGPIPEQPGVLRRNVPHWLRSGLLAPLVLDVVESHQSHGGAGAYYVYLRARR